jgi:hypothetical protein
MSIRQHPAAARQLLLTCFKLGSYRRDAGEHTQRYKLRSSASAQLHSGRAGRNGLSGGGVC